MKGITIITLLSVLMFGQAYCQMQQKDNTLKNTEQKNNTHSS